MIRRFFSRLFRPGTDNWQEAYESAADAEAARMSRASDAELLESIRLGNLGEYSTIWPILGSRSPTPALCWTLFDVLRGDRPYLDKYHCAAALLRLLRCDEFEAVELSASWPEVARNLIRLEAIVASRVGHRATGAGPY